MSSRVCFCLPEPRSLCSVLSGHLFQELWQYLLHFSCPTGWSETGWDLGPLAEVLAPRQSSPQATKYEETMHAYMRSHLSRVRLFGTLWAVAYQAYCRWDFPGKNTGVGCHVFLQGIFPTHGLNPHLLCLLHCKQVLYYCGRTRALVFTFLCILLIYYFNWRIITVLW